MAQVEPFDPPLGMDGGAQSLRDLISRETEEQDEEQDVSHRLSLWRQNQQVWKLQQLRRQEQRRQEQQEQEEQAQLQEMEIRELEQEICNLEIQTGKNGAMKAGAMKQPAGLGSVVGAGVQTRNGEGIDSMSRER
jgi:flagellar biosynthesis/type III secretory pathway protein FliH